MRIQSQSTSHLGVPWLCDVSKTLLYTMEVQKPQWLALLICGQVSIWVAKVCRMYSSFQNFPALMDTEWFVSIRLSTTPWPIVIKLENFLKNFATPISLISKNNCKIITFENFTIKFPSQIALKVFKTNTELLWKHIAVFYTCVHSQTELVLWLSLSFFPHSTALSASPACCQCFCQQHLWSGWCGDSLHLPHWSPILRWIDNENHNMFILTRMVITRFIVLSG